MLFLYPGRGEYINHIPPKESLANNVDFPFAIPRSRQEESLSAELRKLREQVDSKRTSMNEHVSHLDMLREEVRSKKNDRIFID